ncbi:MAG: acidic tetraheme cytochrome c3 TmcA [Desulfococcaceae bacterium]
MSKKYLIPIMVLCFALAVAVLSGYSQENVKFVQDSAFTEKMRPSVYFPHDEHNEKAQISDCHYCHHVYDKGQKVEGESSEDKECSECHMQDGDTDSLARIYHLNCKGCHEDAKAGPVMCAECHNKTKAGILDK